MAKYVYGIKSIKFGTVEATAAMPASLTQWAQTVEGSLTLSEAEDTTKDFKVEESATPVKTVISETGALTITWRAYDLLPALIAVVKGGTATSTTKLDAPVTKATIELALEIETTDGAKFLIYKAAIFARIDGAITRGDLAQMEVKATVLSPNDAGSPYAITFPA